MVDCLQSHNGPVFNGHGDAAARIAVLACSGAAYGKGEEKDWGLSHNSKWEVWS